MSSNRLVLGFDTSAAHCAAALLSGDRVCTERYEARKQGQAEALFPMIEAMLADEGAGWADIDLIGVGIGPGNFTGIRISVSAARGLALALGIPAIGVSAFELIRGRSSLRDTRPALASLAAPRGMLYVQEFDAGVGLGDAQQVTLWQDPICLSSPELAEVRGFEAGEVARYLNREKQGRQVEGVPADLQVIGATAARLAADKLALGKWSGARPSPIYARPADAAPPREAPPAILP